jgi:hypothetical protein
LDFTAQAPTVTVGPVTVATDSADLRILAEPPTVLSSNDVVAGTASLVFVAEGPNVTNVDPGVVLVSSASFRLIAQPVDHYESVLTTDSAVLVLTAQPPGSATVTLPPMDGEVPTSQSFQGDSTFETYKRRTFNA